MFGKYLNNWDFEVVPKGFDCPTCAWMANGGGNYYSPAFVTKNAGAGIPDCLGGHPGRQAAEAADTAGAMGCSPQVRASATARLLCVYSQSVK